MTKRACIPFGLALALLGATALAEPAQGPDERPEKARPASSSARAAAVPTPAEARRHPIVRRAEDLVDLLSLRAAQVQLWLRDARSSQDPKRTRCLDKLLSQTHALERQGDHERRSIEGLMLRGEAWATAPRLQRLAIFSQRSSDLLAEAGECGRQVSRHVRMPTGYQVRSSTPRLPDPERAEQPPRRPKPRRVAGPTSRGGVR
jgi:hypothetical protein